MKRQLTHHSSLILSSGVDHTAATPYHMYCLHLRGKLQAAAESVRKGYYFERLNLVRSKSGFLKCVKTGVSPSFSTTCAVPTPQQTVGAMTIVDM